MPFRSSRKLIRYPSIFELAQPSGSQRCGGMGRSFAGHQCVWYLQDAIGTPKTQNPTALQLEMEVLQRSFGCFWLFENIDPTMPRFVSGFLSKLIRTFEAIGSCKPCNWTSCTRSQTLGLVSWWILISDMNKTIFGSCPVSPKFWRGKFITSTLLGTKKVVTGDEAPLGCGKRRSHPRDFRGAHSALGDPGGRSERHGFEAFFAEHPTDEFEAWKADFWSLFVFIYINNLEGSI